MLNVGDVFVGNPNFKFGRISDRVGYVHGTSVVQVSDSYKETYKVTHVVGYDPKTGVPKYRTDAKYALDDKTRAGAHYVVESVRMDGGDAREMIRDEPHIVARRLNKDGTYDPAGELIQFVYCSKGSRSNFNTAATVEVIRTMTRVVNFI